MPSAAIAAEMDATTNGYFSTKLVPELDGLEVVPGALPLAELDGDTTVVVFPALKTRT